MERKLPKNIRQIGNVSDNPKIYVEDYVDTFFSQLGEKAKEVTLGAFLIGETFRMDDQDYIFVSGAIQMVGVDLKGMEVVVSDTTWKKGCEECKRYFSGNTIVGWGIVGPDFPMELNAGILKTHEKIFMKKSRVLVLKDSLKKEEDFYVYKYNDLMKISGHYIYYEKNPSMQDYMISKRKQNCVTPSEDYEDRAAKDFRSIIREKESAVSKKKNKSSRYVMNVAMVLLLMIVGVTMFEENAEVEQESEMVENTLVEIVADSTEISNGADISDMNISDADIGDVDVGNVDISADETLEELEVNAETNIETSTEVEKDEGDEQEEIVMSQGDESVEVDLEYESGDVYEVQEGDTLARISIKVYGTMWNVDEICEINGLTDSDYIYIGQKLLLP